MTKPHSDECRAHMEEFMQRDEDTLVQQRLHADRLRRGSTVVEASEDERRHPDVEVAGSGLPSGSGGEASRDEGARASTRTRTEAARNSGETLQPWSGEPMQTATEDAETRRGLKRSAELSIDDRFEVVDYISMMMCRLSRLLHNRLSNRQMRKSSHEHGQNGIDLECSCEDDERSSDMRVD